MINVAVKRISLSKNTKEEATDIIIMSKSLTHLTFLMPSSEMGSRLNITEDVKEASTSKELNFSKEMEIKMD